MDFTTENIRDIVFKGGSLTIPESEYEGVEECYEFLKRFSKDKVIYGINTGFGPMAQWKVADADLKNLQYNIIRSHSTGAGKAVDDEYVMAAMIARIGCFMQCRSGVHPSIVKLLTAFVNNRIVPFVPEHGSVGASGDLVQLAHIALCLIGEGKVHYKGEWRKSADVMKECGLQPAQIYIREGLSVTNGTSFMTGVGAVNQLYADNLLKWAVLTGVWINEIASSFDDCIAPELNECRRHSGQQHIAECMRAVASTSGCLKKREETFYSGDHTETDVFDEKVQSYYSLRCIPQILGPVYETLENAKRVINDELNSATDNPIVDPVAGSVFHGGNFHGDYISLEEDKVKIAVVRLTMTAERQLNYLFHSRINNILPPFLNLGKLGLNYGMQACQFTATSTTAESQTLSMPNYVHSIPNNNDNQDIVSMGTNTALITKHVIENGYQVMAILAIALAQATDCLGIKERLSEKTRSAYDSIRAITPKIVDDTPFYDDIKSVEQFLKSSI